jgi:hypothetical protein
MVRYGIIKDSAFVFDKLSDEKEKKKRKRGKKKINDFVVTVDSKTRYVLSIQ